MKNKLLLSVLITGMVLASAGCKSKQDITEKVQPEESTELSEQVTENAETQEQPEESAEEEVKTEPEEQAEPEILPAYHYVGDDPYIETVSQFALENFGNHYYETDICIPAVTILEVDDSDPKDVKLWGCFWIYNYNKNGQILEMESGGEYCGLIHVDGESRLVTDVDLVGDGSNYDKDARRIFGEREGLLDRFYSQETSDRLDEDRRLQTKAYVEANDLDIIAYKDYGWEPVMLDGSTPYHVEESTPDVSSDISAD